MHIEATLSPQHGQRIQAGQTVYVTIPSHGSPMNLNGKGLRKISFSLGLIATLSAVIQVK